MMAFLSKYIIKHHPLEFLTATPDIKNKIE